MRRNADTEIALADTLLYSGKKRLARTLLSIIDKGSRAPKVSQQMLAEMTGITRQRSKSFPNGEKLRPELTRECRQQIVFEERRGACDPRLTVCVGDSHAARHIHEDGHDGVARAGGRQDGDRPEDEQDERTQYERPQRNQRPALQGRQRNQRPAVLKKREHRNDDGQQHGQPPGQRIGEMHY